MYTFHTQTTQAYFECRFWTRTLSMNWRQTHFQSIHLLFFSRVQLKNKTCKSKHIFQQNVQNMSRQNDYSCSSDQRWVFCNSVLLSGGGGAMYVSVGLIINYITVLQLYGSLWIRHHVVLINVRTKADRCLLGRQYAAWKKLNLHLQT